MQKLSLSDINVSEYIPELWNSLSSDQQDYLSKHFKIQAYKKNETIYCEGEKASNLMCLLKGKVKIYKGGVGGRAQIIRVINNGEYFGYRAYFNNECYNTAAAAFESSICCMISMEAVCEVMKTNMTLSRFFINHLAFDLGEADERTVNLTQKHIRGRLAESLIVLKQNYGLEEDGYTLSIYLSREDLANLSNMTTSNAIRTLSQFAQERIIAIDGRKIKLIDIKMLERISKIG